MKKLSILLTVLLVCFCSKESDDVNKNDYYFGGTVYLNNEPVSGVLVNMGYRDTMMQQGEWYTDKMTTTDENGEYEFEMNTVRDLGFQWMARAKHPQQGYWSEWIQGRAVSSGLSGKGIIDIYFIE